MKTPVPMFNLGSSVYLKLNHEKKGMITGLTVRPGNVMLYLVTWTDPIEELEHWACELSDEQEYRDSSITGG